MVTHYTYDPPGRVLTELDPATPDAVNQAVVHTAQTTRTYDADGNVLGSTVSDTTGGDTARATSTVYNDFGEPKTVTDPEQHSTACTYDAYGNQQTETDPDGQSYAFTYDADGNQLTRTITDYTGSSATPGTATAALLEQRMYDPAGQLRTLTDGIGVTTTYAYYDNGLTKQWNRTGSAGTTFVDEQDSYDDAGNLTGQSATGGDATTASRSFRYLLNGRLVASAVGDVLTATGPAGDSSFTYDGDEAPLTRTDAAGTSTYTVELGCSTVVSTDDAARSAVAARLAERPLPKVWFVVVGDRPLTGATHLGPDAVSVRALPEVVTGATAR
ncbi:hypothetical protein ACIRBZ_36875 [Streptomyces sp. NPDC094038]|uniref:hypothetical protein n=1 Tax=Streptomyces sp. NPDC094038 TaxID=3366055 RepID=UPI00382D95F4